MGIILLTLIILISTLYFFIKYKSGNFKDNKDLERSIDKLASRHILQKKSLGLVIGIVKNGKTLIKGYGTVQKGEQVLPDSNSVFELASTSKLFTTSVLQLLVDERKVKIDDKVQTYVAEKVKLPQSAQNTTLQDLATHISGFPSLPNSFIAKMTDPLNPYKDLVIEDLYDYLKTCEGKQSEGTFEYSNFGMGLLGHLLEIKTGIKYEQLVKQKLLNPLGMVNTFVTIDNANKYKVVQGFDENDNPTPVWTDNVLTGAGSFLSNGSDMVKFIKANLKETETVISQSLLLTHQRQLNGETGLGWILPSSFDKLIGNKHIVWHNGMAGGYASFIAIDKKNNYGIVILSNKAIDTTQLGLKLTLIVKTHSWKNKYGI